MDIIKPMPTVGVDKENRFYVVLDGKEITISDAEYKVIKEYNRKKGSIMGEYTEKRYAMSNFLDAFLSKIRNRVI